MNYKEMVAKMEEIGSDGGSVLNMRSEDLQTKHKTVKIPRLKNALKKKSKLLLDTEIALPFNPETGEVEKDGFNEHHKYRPPFSSTTTALALKERANENENLKKTLMQRAGVTEWDTTPTEDLTKTDWDIFDRYRVPRIFSLTVTHVNIPAMNLGAYGRDYAVSVKRDADGKVIGEMPVFLACNKFFRDKAYEEVKEYEELCKSGQCKDDTEAQAKHKGEIYGRVPVSDDKPSNFVRMFEIPVDTSYEISSDVDLKGITKESIKDYEVITNYKKGIRLAVESYKDKSWKRYDTCFDFFDIELTCPTSGDDSTQKGKAQIGQDTKYEKPSVVLTSRDVYDDGNGGLSTTGLIKAIREYIDDDVNVEQRMRVSMYTSVYDEKVENDILRTIETVVDLDNDKYITQKVLADNADFVRLAFSDRDDLLEEIEAGVSDKAEGRLDATDSINVAGTFDLTSDEFTDKAAAEEELSGIEEDLESLDFAMQEA